MRYLIALPLSAEQSSEFIALRDKYKHLAPRWKITLGPHITLYRPSEFKLAKDEAIKAFKQAPAYKSFNSSFKGFQAFLNHSNNAVYSEPKDYSNFKKLRKAYEQVANLILEDTTEVWPFHPHLTLVNRLDTEPAEKLLDDLAKQDFSSDYSFDRVCLYKKEPGDANWVEIASNLLT